MIIRGATDPLSPAELVPDPSLLVLGMTPPLGTAPFPIPGPLWAHTGDKGWTCIQWAPAQQVHGFIPASGPRASLRQVKEWAAVRELVSSHFHLDLQHQGRACSPSLCFDSSFPISPSPAFTSFQSPYPGLPLPAAFPSLPHSPNSHRTPACYPGRRAMTWSWSAQAMPHRMLDTQHSSRALVSHPIPCSLQSLPQGDLEEGNGGKGGPWRRGQGSVCRSYPVGRRGRRTRRRESAQPSTVTSLH